MSNLFSSHIRIYHDPKSSYYSFPPPHSIPHISSSTIGKDWQMEVISICGQLSNRNTWTNKAAINFLPSKKGKGNRWRRWTFWGKKWNLTLARSERAVNGISVTKERKCTLCCFMNLQLIKNGKINHSIETIHKEH